MHIMLNAPVKNRSKIDGSQAARTFSKQERTGGVISMMLIIIAVTGYDAQVQQVLKRLRLSGGAVRCVLGPKPENPEACSKSS